MVYVDDVESTYRAAIAAGATEIQAVEDKFYGDRSGMFKDRGAMSGPSPPTSRDVPDEEMERRLAEMEQG